MTTQTELAGMPEPVVNPRKAPVEVLAEGGTKKKRKPPTKDRARGVIKINLDGENYTVRMKQSGISVRRAGKRHFDFKWMTDVIDFIIGQERLPLENRNRPNPDRVPTDH